MTMQDARFARAFEAVLGNGLDRRALLALFKAGRELRYEELRRAIGEGSPQTFSYSVERLTHHALVRRRLEREGRQKRYKSYLSPSSRGEDVARILDTLGSQGRLPAHLPASTRRAVQMVFVGTSATQVAAR